MIKEAIAAITVLVAATSTAGTLKGVECESFEGVAAVIMQSRQKGVPLKSVMDLNRKTGAKMRKTSNMTEEKIVEWEQATQSVILEAYGSPRYSTVDYQQDAILDFRSDIYRRCLLEN